MTPLPGGDGLPTLIVDSVKSESGQNRTCQRTFPENYLPGRSGWSEVIIRYCFAERERYNVQVCTDSYLDVLRQRGQHLTTSLQLDSHRENQQSIGYPVKQVQLDGQGT